MGVKMETHGILAQSHTALRHQSLGPSDLWDRAAGLDWVPGPSAEWEVEVPPVTCVFFRLGSCPPFSVWVPGTW